MSIEGLLAEKFGNFCVRYGNEIDQLQEHIPELSKPIKTWGVRDLIALALTVQPYWGFVDEGEFDALMEMIGLIDEPAAALALALYNKLTPGRRDQLHKYLVFFLRGVRELASKNGGNE